MVELRRRMTDARGHRSMLQRVKDRIKWGNWFHRTCGAFRWDSPGWSTKIFKTCPFALEEHRWMMMYDCQFCDFKPGIHNQNKIKDISDVEIGQF